MQPLTTFTIKLTPEQGKRLRHVLDEQGFVFSEAPYANFAAAKGKVNLVYYTKGSLVVQGKETQDFVQFILEPQVLQEARLGYEEVLNPELLDARIGVDESGKGDFFGPMCVAAVYVNAEVLSTWKGAGVRDSKTIGSDARISEYARLIRETKGCVYTVVPIGNEAYNRLYAKMRTVNSILAWGHARVIENLLERSDLMKPAPLRAVSDQFAATKDVVESALLAYGKGLPLVQRHKAESDLAVAAASILARDEFVTRLKRLEHQYQTPFPKGASPQVEDAARAFIEKHGAALLPKVAKMHFRTSFRVQGLPEPPKKEWRKKPKSSAPEK